MTDNILDISHTCRMVDVDDNISPTIAEWCRLVLGYVPRIVFGKMISGTYEYVHLIFRNANDPILFKITYADKWN